MHHKEVCDGRRKNYRSHWGWGIRFTNRLLVFGSQRLSQRKKGGMAQKEFIDMT
jgi:hypothetical protein